MERPWVTAREKRGISEAIADLRRTDMIGSRSAEQARIPRSSTCRLLPNKDAKFYLAITRQARLVSDAARRIREAEGPGEGDLMSRARALEEEGARERVSRNLARRLSVLFAARELEAAAELSEALEGSGMCGYGLASYSFAAYGAAGYSRGAARVRGRYLGDAARAAYVEKERIRDIERALSPERTVYISVGTAEDADEE
jgi:hypothetical protein